MTLMTEKTSDSTHTDSVINRLGILSLDTEYPTIGILAWWTISGVELPRPDLAALLRKYGFEDKLPGMPRAQGSIRRALDAWIEDGGIVAHDPFPLDPRAQGISREYRVNVINSAEAREIAFEVEAKDVDRAALGIDHNTSLRVLYEKATDRIVCTNDPKGSIDEVAENAGATSEFRPYYARFAPSYDSAQVSRVVREIVAAHDGIGVRPSGGIYFLPPDQRETVIRIGAMVAELPVAPGHQSSFTAVPQMDAPAAKKQFASAAHTAFLDELTSMQVDLQRFIEAAPGTVKQSTINDRLKAFAEFRTKAEMYAELLGMRQDGIVAGLDALKAKALQVALKDDVVADAGDSAEQTAFSFPGLE